MITLRNGEPWKSFNENTAALANMAEKSDNNQNSNTNRDNNPRNGQPLKSPHSEESSNLDSEKSTNQNADFSP